MQVTELESKGLFRKFKITVDAAQINAQTEAELKQAGEQVKIPGFRPGNIPMKVLKQRYGKNVQADVLKQVINRSSTDAITERKLRPSLMPQINIEEYNEGGDLTFTMTFETFPETPDIDFSKITLDRKLFDVSEKDIDEAAKNIAERSPKLDRAPENIKAGKGNVVVLDFRGSIDGVDFPGGTATNFRLELGSGQFIEGFEDQLIGVKEGDERTVNVTFPEAYHAKELAGKPAEFAVKIHEIHTKASPEIDEAFAKERGFADLRALREAIRNQIVREYDQLVRNNLKKQLFDQLEEMGDFDLPGQMVDLEFNSIWERLKQAQAQGDESVSGRDDEELKEEYRKIAGRRVKLGLLLADTGTRNKLKVTNEELSRAAMQQASMFPGQEKKVMEFYRNNPDRVDDLRGPILEEKAVDHILSKTQFNDRKVTIEELLAEDGADNEEAKKPAKSKPAKKTPKKKSDEE